MFLFLEAFEPFDSLGFGKGDSLNGIWDWGSDFWQGGALKTLNESWPKRRWSVLQEMRFAWCATWGWEGWIVDSGTGTFWTHAPMM